MVTFGFSKGIWSMEREGCDEKKLAALRWEDSEALAQPVLVGVIWDHVYQLQASRT